MDAIVQFVRNLLCCIKDLHLFPNLFIHDVKYTHQLLPIELPSPLDETTPLEVIISITQLYACISVAKSGFNLLTSSIGKLRRILRIVEYRMTKQSQAQQPSSESESQQSSLLLDAERIVNESLLKEAKMAFRMVWIGFFVTPIGICFWWLFINSWHVTSVDWFGGLPALIHALEVMEICLLPLLFFMIKDGFEMLTKSNAAKEVFELVQSHPNTLKISPNQIHVQTYEVMTGWVPFWDAGTSMLTSNLSDVKTQLEMELVDKEIKTVRTTLEMWFEGSKSDGDKTSKKDDGEKEDKIRQEALEDARHKLEAAIPTFRLEGYREFLYFVLNFIAFYGYLMAPLTFYYDDETNQPYHIQSMKLWYQNSDADWTGNFAGDLCWTIEPIVILGSPFLVSWVKPPSKKKTSLSSSSNKVKSE